MEIWKDIKNTYGTYQVSNLGNVKSVRYKRILKPCITGSQYYQVKLSLGGTHIVEYIHRLVAFHFLDYDESNVHMLRVNHKNLIKTDNRLENLELVTQKQNVIHFYNTAIVAPRFMKAVVHLDLENNVIGEYYGINEAARETGISAGTIHSHVHGKIKGRKRKIKTTFKFKDELQN